MLFIVSLVLFIACLFSVFMFWDYCFFFVSIFIFALFNFFNFFNWIPIVMALYLLLIDFAHIVLDYLFIILAQSFVYYLYLLNAFKFVF
jgi:hypothetical protein